MSTAQETRTLSTRAAATKSRTVKTSVLKVGGKSYLSARVTSAYGAAKRFTVKQRVCAARTCRTATVALTVGAGMTGWQERYLGTGSYRRSGAPRVSVTAPPAVPAAAPVATPTVTVTVKETVRETVTVDPVVAAAPTVTVTVTATPTVTVTAPAPGTEDTLCGAPANTYGFTYCTTGARVDTPVEEACLVFSCIDYFSEGEGYLVMCADGKVSMSGGINGVCSYHGGWLRDIYRFAT
ncbi:hypothetical protein ACFQ08_03735 [Streptosporangium algeriense]|uniref:Chitin-binding type-2 domain-containing protein n=1 Tax=Streptosporangium algeriense TaxID=1682748 RepID=A0ABW3DIU1_9ACTN